MGTAAPPTMNWRVGQTGISSGGAARVNDEFRVDVNKLGRLTPSEVRAQSQLAKDLRQQVVLAKQYKSASEDVIGVWHRFDTVGESMREKNSLVNL